MSIANSLRERALETLVGGVNSPIRAKVRPGPFFTSRGEGPYIYTLEGKQLIDYVLGYGPLILGHAHPHVAEALVRQVRKGWLFGTPHELEVGLAEKVLELVWPGGKVRFVNSGTEAVATALRLARGYTGRDKIVMFKGSYHGGVDHTLVSPINGSWKARPKPGIPQTCADNVLLARFNDLDSVKRIFEEKGEEVAAVIMEPVMANHGLIPGEPGFVAGVRRLTEEHGSLLIFDETVTGFRLSLGGAQQYYGVKADLVTLGKILGGGMPIGAVVGDPGIMNKLTPSGSVFSAGTFNGHPLTMAAGLATLEVLVEERAWERAVRASEKLAQILRGVLDQRGLEWSVQQVPGMLQVFFSPSAPRSPDEPLYAFSENAYRLIHERLLDEGVFIPPSQLEVWFTSSSHSDEVLEQTAVAFEKSIGGGQA